MEMKEEIRINAPREKVFAALNDAEVLKGAIPGCEELEKVSDTEFTATVVAKVGPIKASFKGEVTLSELNPPESYVISGHGTGGAAGFAKGGVRIQLIDEGPVTLMRYEVKVDVGGKLAQMGGRLIDGTSRRLANQFFENFEEIVGAPAPAGVQAPEPKPAKVPLAWIIGAGIVLAALIYFAVTGL